MARSISPTPAELKNGWVESGLHAYIAERNRAAFKAIFGDPGDKKRRPLRVENARRFNPHHWIKSGG